MNSPATPIQLPAITDYPDVRRAARILMDSERSDHTLQPTALVHEAYLRVLTAQHPPTGDERAMTIALVRAMRLVLVDHARKRSAAKRPTSKHRLNLDALEPVTDDRRDDLILNVNDALDNLKSLDPELADIVELRFFAALEESQCADLLNVSTRTVRRRWRVAKFWLARELDLN